MAKHTHMPPTFGYGNPRASGGGRPAVADHDEGWGCVYRSVQNVQSFLGMPVASMTALLHKTGRRPGQWAEPAMFADRRLAGELFPGASIVRAVVCGRTDNLFKFTKYEQYFTTLANPVPGTQDAFVVDDGTSAYAIVPFEGKQYWVDPHTGPTPAATPFSSQLSNRQGWMVLQVRARIRSEP